MKGETIATERFHWLRFACGDERRQDQLVEMGRLAGQATSQDWNYGEPEQFVEERNWMMKEHSKTRLQRLVDAAGGFGGDAGNVVGRAEPGSSSGVGA